MTLRFDLASFNKRIESILRDVPDEVTLPALEVTAKKIIAESKAITPVDTGKLRSSLTQEVKKEGTKATARLGSDVEYALIVHEDLSKTHFNGQAKFLERPLRRNVKTLQASVRERLRRLRR